MSTDAERIASLELEVKRLNIRLETLVNFLNTTLGLPDGRDPYDLQVESNLAELGLEDSRPSIKSKF